MEQWGRDCVYPVYIPEWRMGKGGRYILIVLDQCNTAVYHKLSLTITVPIDIYAANLLYYKIKPFHSHCDYGAFSYSRLELDVLWDTY